MATNANPWGDTTEQKINPNSNPWPTAPAGGVTPSSTAPASGNPWASMDANSAFSSQGSSLVNPGATPQVQAGSFAISPELQKMLAGAGFADSTLAQMHAGATEAPAAAGLQEMGQVKRALGQAGVTGPAAAAYEGNVARQTGQNQVAANREVDTQNAQAGLANQQFAVGQQTGIGENNLQSSQAAALANAQAILQMLSNNQAVRMGTQQQLGAIQ